MSDGATPFVYEGEVILGCQEGGCADPSIDLTGRGNETLAEALLEQFGPCPRNDFGDDLLGSLRITVERA